MVKLLFLKEVKQVGSGAGGRVGSGVAEPEIAATTPKQIAAQINIWRPWDLNPHEDGVMSIVLILIFSIERTRTSFLLNKRLFRLTYLLRAVSRKKTSTGVELGINKILAIEVWRDVGVIGEASCRWAGEGQIVA